MATARQDGAGRSFRSTRHWQELLLFSIILLLAAFLRLYRLDQLPPGLHYDEAFNATMAQRVGAGVERPIFFREDLTEEPLAIYVTALSFALFGASPWSLRLVSALAGLATVAALYALARALFQTRGSAALAAFVLAILYWHVGFSRLGMEPIFLPLMLTLAFTFLWRGLRHASRVTRHASRTPHHPSTEFILRNEGLRTGSSRTILRPFDKLRAGFRSGQPPHASRITSHIDFALAGLFLAATQYTYKAALFVPLLIAVFLGAEILADKTFWARHARGLLIFTVGTILVFAPLGLYFIAHPGEFLERPLSVTTGTSLSTSLEHAARVAAMFFVRGDDNPRSNLPGRPALDPFLALGFVVGLLACVARLRRRESRFLLLWLVVMVLPSVLSDFAPHFGRSIGATPAVALIVAYGFEFIIETVRRQPRWLLPTVYCLLFTGLAFSAVSTMRDYFAVWGAHTGLFDSFDVGLLSLAQALRKRPADESLYLSPVESEHYTIRFGLAGRDAHSFDGRRVLVLAPTGAAAYGIVTREDRRSLARLGKIFPQGRVVERIDNFTGKAYAVILRADGEPHIAPQKTVRARLGDAIELVGYDLAREDNAIALTVYWRSIAATRDDYTVFVHLLRAEPRVWAQDDTRPGHGSYPTARWQVGEVVIDDYRLALPADAPRGDYQIAIGMYLLKTGARVRVLDANGAPLENDRVLLERLSLP